MRIPLTIALNPTSSLRLSQFDVSKDDRGSLLSTFAAPLTIRQADTPPPPDPASISIVTLTSIAIVTASPTVTSSATPRSKPTTSEISIPPPISARTTTPSTTHSSADPSPSTKATSTTDTAVISSATPTLTISAFPSQSISAKPTNSLPPPGNDGKHIGLIAGIAVGSVIGAILLGLLVYWIYACYRGVNVCNCFGLGSRSKSVDDNDKPLPHPPVLSPGHAKAPSVPYLMSGIGAAPRMNNVPRPLLLPRQVAEERTSRLQRKTVVSPRHGLDTIPEAGKWF